MAVKPNLNNGRHHLEFTSGASFSLSLQLFIFLPNFINISQPAIELLHFVEKFKNGDRSPS